MFDMFRQERIDLRVYAVDTDLVVHFQAIPVRLELLQTVFTHLANTTVG
jgi:hypothetical protein